MAGFDNGTTESIHDDDVFGLLSKSLLETEDKQPS